MSDMSNMSKEMKKHTPGGRPRGKKRERPVSFPTAEVEAKLGYVFRDKSLLIQAFTRTSFCNEQGVREVPYQSNQVLEFFGDSVLSVAIVTLLMRHHTERYEHGISTRLTEGDLTTIRSHLSDKTNLSHSMQQLGLSQYLLMGEGDRRGEMQNGRSVMEDLFESIVGAVYIDCAFDIPTVLRVVERMLDVSTYLSEGGTRALSASDKNALQEWCQDKRRRYPFHYERLSESGPDHDKVFTAACYVRGVEMGRGSGRRIPEAEAAAARAALLRLQAEEAGAVADTSADEPS